MKDSIHTRNLFKNYPKNNEILFFTFFFLHKKTFANYYCDFEIMIFYVFVKYRNDFEKKKKGSLSLFIDLKKHEFELLRLQSNYITEYKKFEEN